VDGAITVDRKSVELGWDPTPTSAPSPASTVMDAPELGRLALRMLP